MKLIVIEENDIVIVYRFEVNEREQMLGAGVERKKRLPTRKNNFI